MTSVIKYDTAININTRGPICHIGIAEKSYVNRQRQGRIMKDHLALEIEYQGKNKSYRKFHQVSFPTVDVEGEITMVSNHKGNIEDNLLAQKMREMGLERGLEDMGGTRILK